MIYFFVVLEMQLRMSYMLGKLPLSYIPSPQTVVVVFAK
jgi:hypothetical protein